MSLERKGDAKCGLSCYKNTTYYDDNDDHEAERSVFMQVKEEW